MHHCMKVTDADGQPPAVALLFEFHVIRIIRSRRPKYTGAFLFM